MDYVDSRDLADFVDEIMIIVDISAVLIREIIRDPVRSLQMFEIKAFTLPGGYGSTEYRIKKGIDELLAV